MSELGLPLAALFVSFGALAVVAAWRSGWTRLAACLLLPAVLGVAGYAWAELLGRPAPRAPAAETAVLWHAFEEPEAIFVLVDEAGAPRLHRLPWSEQAAKALQGAAETAESQGQSGEVRMRPDSPAGEPMFYAAPPQPNPPKRRAIASRGG